MKKRYLAAPLLVGAVSAAYLAAFDRPPAKVSAETIAAYMNPAANDTRFPVEVYTIGLTAGETLAEAVAKLPMTIYPEDRLTPLFPIELGLGGVIQIKRAALLTLTDGKKTFLKRTFVDTVGQFLDEVNRPLAGFDRVSPAAEAKIAPGMKITVTRVAKISRTVTLAEPFSTSEKTDANADRGTARIEKPGRDGVRTNIFEDTREDGVVVKTILRSSQVTTKPESKIVVKGVRIRYGATVAGRATWYSAGTRVAMNALPKGTWVEIANPVTGRKIEVQVDDSGGFAADTVVDLHPALFRQLGFDLGRGAGHVVVRQELTPPN